MTSMTELARSMHPVVNRARSVAGRAPVGLYDAEARLADAPNRFSATSLIVWCFDFVGITLQDDLLILHRSGERIVGSGLLGADLVFRTGRKDLFHGDDRRYGVGHVGIFTGEGTVVHASPFVGCVHEDLIDDFIDVDRGHFRGVCRITLH